jgi:hypothetical protein
VAHSRGWVVEEVLGGIGLEVELGLGDLLSGFRLISLVCGGGGRPRVVRLMNLVGREEGGRRVELEKQFVGRVGPDILHPLAPGNGNGGALVELAWGHRLGFPSVGSRCRLGAVLGWGRRLGCWLVGSNCGLRAALGLADCGRVGIGAFLVRHEDIGVNKLPPSAVIEGVGNVAAGRLGIWVEWLALAVVRRWKKEVEELALVADLRLAILEEWLVLVIVRGLGIWGEQLVLADWLAQAVGLGVGRLVLLALLLIPTLLPRRRR